MTRPSRRLVLASPALWLANVARAQAYPTRPVRLVVPFPPGGGNDNVACPVAARVSQTLGQPVVIENRPGAGTMIGAEAVAKSAPDGYTLFFGSIGSHAVSPQLYPVVPYDPVRDFAPVILLATAPNVLVVNPNGPFADLASFMAAARASPGRYTYASPGAGTPAHLAGEIFKAMTGLDLLHVPYRGGANYIPDIMAGRVDSSFDTATSSGSFVRQGQLRALAVAAPERSSSLPDVPTFAQAGLPGYETGSWYGVLAPARTPEPIITLLHDRFAEALRTSEVRTRLVDMGAEPAGGTPQDFGALIARELARYGDLIRRIGVRAE